MRGRPYGITFAWLIIILLIPFLGALTYLLFGENRISERRTRRIRQAQEHYTYWLNSLRSRAPVDWATRDPVCRPIHRQGEHLIGIPAMAGNELQLIETPDDIIDAIIADINTARSTCHLQFYIWYEGGKVHEVEEALLAAAKRGVTCRLLGGLHRQPRFFARQPGEGTEGSRDSHRGILAGRTLQGPVFPDRYP